LIREETYSHGTLVGAGKRSDADLGVDVEDGRLSALGVGLDTNTSSHVVVVLIRRGEGLGEDILLYI
jgi:hypothetical protein